MMKKAVADDGIDWALLQGGIRQVVVFENDTRIQAFFTNTALPEASIASDPSTPSIVISGNAFANRTVTSAGPHPRSSTRPRVNWGNRSRKYRGIFPCDSLQSAAAYAAACS